MRSLPPDNKATGQHCIHKSKEPLPSAYVQLVKLLARLAVEDYLEEAAKKTAPDNKI